MRKINIIGFGNIGQALFRHLKAKLDVNVYAKTKFNFQDTLVLPVELLDNSADLTIICVPDDQIEEVAKKIPNNLRVVHTSGSVPMSVLQKFNEHGVLYPLQTFSKNRLIDMTTFPWLIESCEIMYNSLFNFTHDNISTNILNIDSEKRLRIHIAAVIANNFTTYLLNEASELISEQHISIHIIKPLMTETIEKYFTLGYTNSQTGPARRGDIGTINNHMNIIHDDFKAIYTLITDKIISKFTV